MQRLDSHARIGAAQVSEHKFQNPAFFLCVFYAIVVLLKWRHGLHHHVSSEAQGVRNPGEYGRGGDTENRRGVGGKRLSNEAEESRSPHISRKCSDVECKWPQKNMLFASV